MINSRELPATVGIYKICNSVDNRYYIGSAVNIKLRIIKHKQLLNHNKHFNRYLQRFVNKYGLDKLYVDVLMECSKEQLVEMEQKFIDDLKPEFNLRKLANSCLGIRHTKETRHKWSVMKLGTKNPMAKLTPTDVRAIRKSNKTCQYLAQKYKISASQIWQVRTYNSYKNIV